LLDDESILSQIEIAEDFDIESEVTACNESLDKFNNDFEQIMQICEAYEQYSMYHFILKSYLKNEVKVGEKLTSDDDAKKITIAKFKIKQASLLISHYTACEVNLEEDTMIEHHEFTLSKIISNILEVTELLNEK